jgi:hypothetical protein
MNRLLCDFLIITKVENVVQDHRKMNWRGG